MLNHTKIMLNCNAVIEKAVVDYFKSVTPEKLLRGKFVRKNIDVFIEDAVEIQYVNASNPNDDTIIGLVAPLRDGSTFEFVIQTDGNGVGYPFETQDFSKKNIREQAKKAYDFFCSED